jgi:sporulation protein YlmC with PRC-barrel domain
MATNHLLNRRVMLNGGIEVGRVVDVILEANADRALGLDVLCRDGEHRFLPMAAVASVAADVEIDSALTLLEPPELEFYRAHGRSLRGGASGTLADR